MSRRPQLARLLALAVPFAFIACGDETKKPGDTQQTDTQVGDTAQPLDTENPLDTASTEDTAAPDTSTADTNTADTTAADTTAADTSVADTSVADTAGDTTASTICKEDEDCGWCTFATAPTSLDECTCPMCPTTSMTTATCQENTTAWNAICGGDKWHDTAVCPVPRCSPLTELVCDEGTCAKGCDASQCPALLCPVEQQVTPPGECCPTCGPTPGCADDGDCTMCTFATEVKQPEDCYCLFCASTPMTTAQCTANAKAWAEHCEPWPLPDVCPVASCIPSAAPVCDPGGECQANPNSCFSSDECGSCKWDAAPTSAADCQCPGCPGPLRIETCEARHAAVDEHCVNFDFASCAIPSCARPPAIGCTQDWTCGYGDLLPE